jgi:RNA polymerase sigma-70 factor (ECF subfamily)
VFVTAVVELPGKCRPEHENPSCRIRSSSRQRSRTGDPSATCSLVVESDPDTGSALERADDAFLVGRAQDGDPRAFTVLLLRHNRSLRVYVERLTRNPSDTDDVLQDTAVIAWRRLASIREPAKVRAWLIQIATREALKAVAARPRHHELTDESTRVDGPDQDTDRLDTRKELREVLDTIPVMQARSWVLRELGGYSYREIAVRLGIPESTVRGNLAQARKSILNGMGGKR